MTVGERITLYLCAIVCAAIVILFLIQQTAH
jgi:hypothetical protein